MESQVHHPVGHTYEQDPHNVGLHSVVEDEGRENHEKTSVLKKVKDKAKKIRHKLHLDGQGHEHEHEQDHGNKLEHDFAHDARSGYEEDDEEDEDEEIVQDPEIQGAPMYESAAIRSAIPEPKQPQAPTLGTPTATADYPMTPAGSMKETNPGHHGVSSAPQIGDLIPLQEDPHSPNPAGRISPPNYESKVSDPTGEPGKAADINPSLISSLDKMTVTTRSHDQFLPESVPALQENYAQKMTLAPSMIADKAVSVKNTVASKLGYGDKPGPGASEYVQKVAATLAPVYEKVADAGSTVVSKVRGGGDVAAAPDKGVSVTEYLSEKLRPGEDDKALSDMISDKLHLSKVSDVVKAGESHPTPVGRVTESEEVRRDLGSGMENKREGEDAIAAGKENTGGGGGAAGSGMVDRLKGAVTSWMGKQVEQGAGVADPPSQVRHEGREVGEKAEFGAEERRLQGSGN